MKPIEDIAAAIVAIVVVGIVCAFTVDQAPRVVAGTLLGSEALYFVWKSWKSWPK